MVRLGSSVIGSILVLCSNFYGINITGGGRFKFKNHAWRILSYSGWLFFILGVSVQITPEIPHGLQLFTLNP